GRLRDETLGARRIGDVELERDLRRKPLDAPRAAGNAHTRVCERGRRRPPDARGGTGHDRPLAGQIQSRQLGSDYLCVCPGARTRRFAVRSASYSTRVMDTRRRQPGAPHSHVKSQRSSPGSTPSNRLAASWTCALTSSRTSCSSAEPWLSPLPVTASP